MKKLILAAAVSLTVLGGAAAATATIPGPDGTVHGCYKKTTNTLKPLSVIGSAKACPSGTAAISWPSQIPPDNDPAPTASAVPIVHTFPQGEPRNVASVTVSVFGLNIELDCGTWPDNTQPALTGVAQPFIYGASYASGTSVTGPFGTLNTFSYDGNGALGGPGANFGFEFRTCRRH